MRREGPETQNRKERKLRAGEGVSLYPAQVFPVQKVREALGAVPLDDALTPALLAEAVEERGELRAGVIQAAEPPVQNVDACGVGWG